MRADTVPLGSHADMEAVNESVEHLGAYIVASNAALMAVGRATRDLGEALDPRGDRSPRVNSALVASADLGAATARLRAAGAALARARQEMLAALLELGYKI